MGAHPHALSRVLCALAGLGVFAETTEGHFALTPLATLLQSGVPGSQRASAIWWGETWQWQAYGALLYSVRTNRSAFEHAHGLPFYAYMDHHADAAASFNAWMMSATAPDAATIATAYDFSRIATLIAVGGGEGMLLTTLLHAYPQMRGVLFDLPTVVEGAREAMALAGLAHRCTLTAAGFMLTTIVPTPSGLSIIEAAPVEHQARCTTAGPPCLRRNACREEADMNEPHSPSAAAVYPPRR